MYRPRNPQDHNIVILECLPRKYYIYKIGEIALPWGSPLIILNFKTDNFLLKLESFYFLEMILQF
jgi:hypothetical protein